jgi:hypothetical protein
VAERKRVESDSTEFSSGAGLTGGGVGLDSLPPHERIRWDVNAARKGGCDGRRKPGRSLKTGYRRGCSPSRAATSTHGGPSGRSGGFGVAAWTGENEEEAASKRLRTPKGPGAERVARTREGRASREEPSPQGAVSSACRRGRKTLAVRRKFSKCSAQRRFES